MVDRPKFFDDIAGVAGGAFSAIAGMGEEMGALVRTRVDEALAKLALVRREEFEVVSELASQARAGQEQAETRLAALEARVAALEAGRRTGVAEPAAPVTGATVTGAPDPGASGLGASDAGNAAPSAARHDPHASHGAPGGPPASDPASDPASQPPPL